MGRLLRLLRLSRSDCLLLIKTFIWLGLIRLGLWILPFKVLLEYLSKASQPDYTTSNSSIKLHKIIWAVDVNSRYMPGYTKCLARALTTQVLLTQQGYASDLRIGVAKHESGHLQAHAWIEYQGTVVIGNLEDLSRFSPLPSFKGVQL
jgi:hypothetical protein